jgi:predicted nuclease of restriction endonuclease-like (RecB) superfamily
VFAKAYPDEIFLQQVAAKIPWFHHCILLDKVKDEQERLWYIQQTVKNGWSRNILAHQIDANLFHRQGKALTNFTQTLPSPQSDLARDTLKDPYIFDFLMLQKASQEKVLQAALLQHLQHFLLELGMGFTFVGSNYRITVGNRDFYIDLLFYHLDLRCFVVIELKIGEFQPEYAGKVGFYLEAVDKQLKRPTDNPTIGLILCRTSGEKVVAEYALKSLQAPVGVASYKFTASLPEALKAQLPDTKQLEEEVKREIVTESIGSQEDIARILEEKENEEGEGKPQ